MEQLFWLTCLCHVYKTVAKMTPAWSKTVSPQTELKTYYTCLSPTCSHFQCLVVLQLCFSRMDDLTVSQHVCERIIPLRHVLFLTPNVRNKNTMYIPITERAVLPTRLVFLDYLEEHRKTSILTQLHTPLYRTHI